MSLEIPENGTTLTCPICGKEFKATDKTRFIRKNAWTCSWDCFMKGIPKTITSGHKPKSKKASEDKPKRGRASKKKPKVITADDVRAAVMRSRNS